MWLILRAAGADGLGPDTSLAGAPGLRLVGDALRMALAGKTLRFADTAPDGPYAMRLAADGSASLAKGPSRRIAFTGKWWVDGETLCRAWDRFHPNFDSWPVRIDGATVGLYQEDDTMYLRAVAAQE